MGESMYKFTIDRLRLGLFLLAACLMVTGCAAQSNPYLGQDLEESCGTDDSGNLAYCIGYLRGMDNAVSAFFEEGGVNEFSDLYCIDQDPSYSDQRQIILDWLAAHPEKRQDSAWSVIHRSLSEAYPCPEISLEDLEKDLATSNPGS